ncbi:hypothetical protein [Pseudomonas sp. B11(2017)]|uniref:hypothetical protein n=1 Tax=Pseudomonas sp. B11(2017) TaxID=1981748 RepID=UPI000A1DCCEA|nr:hypothetical protein [Pseudomonas sp. B11(2017)]
MKTAECLGIFWSSKDPATGNVCQDEVSGLIFYGYWSQGFSSEFANRLAAFEAIWQGRAQFNPRLWEDASLSDLSVEVRILAWPSDSEWPSLIERSLAWFVSLGATIAWCGTEYSSPSIEVFSLDDEQWAGSVYAAYSNATGLLLGSGLSADYRELEAVELNHAYKAAFGLV